MPLHESTVPLQAINALAGAKERFYVFYSSRDAEGMMWCPDCRRVELLVKKAFESRDDAIVVWAGNKEEWKSPSSPLRKAPWAMRVIPTIIKRSTADLNNFVEEARLVDADITEENLAAFVHG